MKTLGFAQGGYRFQATEVEAAVRTLALAAGEMSETEFAAWLKENSRRMQGRTPDT